MIEPTVTVAVCTIPGREALLERALASVRAQTRPPDALVVYCDVERFGAAPARTRALSEVTSTHVAWLDDDDELLPNHLAVLTEAAARVDADVTYPWFICDPPTADNLRCAGPGNRLRSPFGLPFSDAMRAQLVRGNNFLHLTALIRVEALRAVGAFTAGGARGSSEDATAYRALAAAGATFHHVAEMTWVWHRGAQGTAGRGRRVS